jgi:hypothetical protein
MWQLNPTRLLTCFFTWNPMHRCMPRQQVNGGGTRRTTVPIAQIDSQAGPTFAANFGCFASQKNAKIVTEEANTCTKRICPNAIAHSTPGACILAGRQASMPAFPYACASTGARTHARARAYVLKSVASVMYDIVLLQ